MSSYAVCFQEISEAAERLHTLIHRTPVLSSKLINNLVGAEVFFKCENFQKVGAFKFRGGLNSVLQLDDQVAHFGVCTHSSGNHAQAIALAAHQRQIPAYIVMPSNAPAVKKAAVLGYGAEVIECEPTLQARETTAEQVIQKTNATFIHPYNHPHVIAGQGTAALELIEEVGNLDLMIAPIGGGGLMSATAITTKALLPHALIWGAEPEGADDAFRSWSTKKHIPQTNPNTICDGLLTSLGSLTWPIIRDHVDWIQTVSDLEVLDALRLIWTRMKILIETSCATPLAALLKADLPPNVKRVGVILSGGNVDLDRLPW
jgi:threonine dehydratase